MLTNDWIDREMKQRYGATLQWHSDIGDAVRCYESPTQRLMVELKNGKWAIYTFSEELNEE